LWKDSTKKVIEVVILNLEECYMAVDDLADKTLLNTVLVSLKHEVGKPPDTLCY
jgi:hypothetical protein